MQLCGPDTCPARAQSFPACRSTRPGRPDHRFRQTGLRLLDQRAGLGIVALQEGKVPASTSTWCPQLGSARPARPAARWLPSAARRCSGLAGSTSVPGRRRCASRSPADAGSTMRWRADVADLAVDDFQPFVLIMTGQLWCGSFDKITVVLGVPSMGDGPGAGRTCCARTA